MRGSRLFALLVAGAAAIVVAVGSVGVASASTTVNCNAAGGAAAFQAALTAGGTIDVSGTCVGNFTLPSNVTVIGSPAATITANGSGRPLTISMNKTVTLTSLTITGGHTTAAGPPGAGGGIFGFNDTLTLNNCIVTGNTVENSAGGGIASGTPGSTQAGTLTLNSTQVTNNSAVDGGGGILNHNGTATLNSSVVSGNTAQGGGGIASGSGAGDTTVSGTLTITGSLISNNSALGGADGGGGGIANGGHLTVSNSTINGNRAVGGAGAGIFSHGVAAITESTISGNAAPDDSQGDQGFGGGIASFNFGVNGTGTLSLDRTQVTRNIAGLGGGIAAGGFGGDASTTITNSAVSLNNVSGDQSGGGGIASVSGAGNTALTISGSVLVGNLARQGLGGAIANVSQGGEASVSITQTTIGSTVPHPPYTLNPNRAAFGGGIFNWAMAGPADVTLGSGGLVVGNQASVNGGGIFNADGASLTISGGLVLLNHPNNVISDPGF